MASIHPRTLSPGDTIAGYRIDAVVDRGGMGVVYRATQLALGQQYALKAIAPELAYDLEFQDRFKRETMVAASLRHPNIVGVHYAGDQDGVLFLAMDYIDGTDLREVLKHEGAMHPERAVALLEQVTSALDEAHANGLVHRDVKPANVLIQDRGGREHAFLTDFGLAKQMDSQSGLTKTGMLAGTVDYMAPEQAAGARLDARTDVYALGCVLFEMLTGRVPFERPDTIATLFAHRYDPPPPLRSVRPDLDPAFEQVVARALAKDPAERYMSAGDLGRAARAAAQGTAFRGSETIVATGDARPEPPPQAAAPSAPPPSPASFAGQPPSPASFAGPPPSPASFAAPPPAPPAQAAPPGSPPPAAAPAPRPATVHRFRTRRGGKAELVASAAGFALLVAMFPKWAGFAASFNAFHLVYRTGPGIVGIANGIPLWPIFIACVALSLLLFASSVALHVNPRPLAAANAITAAAVIFLIANYMRRDFFTVVPKVALALAVVILAADLVLLVRPVRN